jgi:hypothetical protein
VNFEPDPVPTGPTMSQRRFPPPWSVEETAPRFIVRDANGKALALSIARMSRVGAVGGAAARE